MLRSALLAGLLALPLASLSAATLEEDAKAFGARDTVQWMDISPSGKLLLAVTSNTGRASVVKIMDQTTQSVQPIVLSAGDPESIDWCKFASETQLVCKYGGYTKVDNDVVGFSRLVTLGVDGKNIRQLGQQSHANDLDIRQFDGDLLDWLPDQPGSVLMQRNYVPQANFTGVGAPEEGIRGLGVDRIDLSTLKVSRVEAPVADAEAFLTDGRGNVRMMLKADTQGGSLTGNFHVKYRRNGSRDWQDFAQYNAPYDTGDFPLAVEADSDSAFVLTKTDGRDALYRVKLDGSGARTLIAANQKVDIDDVVRLGNGQKVIGYSFVDDRRRTVYFDPTFQKLAGSLAKAVPFQPAIVSFLNATADGSKLLLRASGDSDPGSFYVFDRGTMHLNEVAPVRVGLLNRQLAAVEAITFPSGDATVPAYLTLPPGSSGKNLPAVILPHGGPSARDEWGFDWLPQFLAARGYAVIQPEFRGSAGFGDDWLARNGFQGWRTAIADITASAQYLVAQGIADPKRLAIVGWSYGGYASLLSAAEQPQLYRAAVAIAPVTDLSLLKREARDFTNGRLVATFVGSGPDIGPGSPLRRANDIKVPVLLFHGDLDGNVTIAHSEKMAAALQKAGDRVGLVRFKGLDHQLEDSDARAQMLTKIGTFLDAAIGH